MSFWHPTWCRAQAKPSCQPNSHDLPVYRLPDQHAAVIANLYVWGADPIPLVVVDASTDFTMSPAQAKAFASAVLVAADAAESARTEWLEAHK